MKTKRRVRKHGSAPVGAPPKIIVMGHSVGSVLRWMGYEGLTSAQATIIMEKMKVVVARNTIYRQVHLGRTRAQFPAPLTIKQKKKLLSLAPKADTVGRFKRGRRPKPKLIKSAMPKVRSAKAKAVDSPGNKKRLLPAKKKRVKR